MCALAPVVRDGVGDVQRTGRCGGLWWAVALWKVEKT